VKGFAAKVWLSLKPIPAVLAAERPNVYSPACWKELFASGGAQCAFQQSQVVRSSGASKFFGPVGSINIGSFWDRGLEQAKTSQTYSLRELRTRTLVREPRLQRRQSYVYSPSLSSLRDRRSRFSRRSYKGRSPPLRSWRPRSAGQLRAHRSACPDQAWQS
jgi:hypothetical protein